MVGGAGLGSELTFKTVNRDTNKREITYSELCVSCLFLDNVFLVNNIRNKFCKEFKSEGKLFNVPVKTQGGCTAT